MSTKILKKLRTFAFDDIIAYMNDARFQSQQMHNATLTAKLYNAGRRILSSEFVINHRLSNILRDCPSGKTIVEIGSGNRKLRGDIVNIDLFTFPHVNVVSDAAFLSLRNASIDLVVIDTVLEHLPDPSAVISEIYRVLKPKGKVVCITTFIFPYHGYPKHYYNFSRDGLEYLFRKFSDCEVKVNMGPASGLVNLISEYFAVLVSGKSAFLYTLVKGITLLPLFIFKYLDILWRKSEKAFRLASHLSVIATK